MTVELYPSSQRYETMEKLWQFYAQVIAKVDAIPGVASAGLTEELPFSGDFGCTVQGFEDAGVYEQLKRSHQTECAGQETTSPGYFAAMGIPVLKGREFVAGDNDSPLGGAVVVSKTFADRFWPGEDPIGKGTAPNGNGKGPFYHVVGVVGDVHISSLDGEMANAIYYPIVAIPHTGQWFDGEMALVIRTTRGSPDSYLNAVRRAVAEVDPAVPIANAQEMETVVARSMSRLTFTMTLLGDRRRHRAPSCGDRVIRTHRLHRRTSHERDRRSSRTWRAADTSGRNGRARRDEAYHCRIGGRCRRRAPVLAIAWLTLVRHRAMGFWSISRRDRSTRGCCAIGGMGAREKGGRIDPAVALRAE